MGIVSYVTEYTLFDLQLYDLMIHVVNMDFTYLNYLIANILSGTAVPFGSSRCSRTIGSMGQ